MAEGFLQNCGERLKLSDKPLELRFFQLARIQPKAPPPSTKDPTPPVDPTPPSLSPPVIKPNPAKLRDYLERLLPRSGNSAKRQTIPNVGVSAERLGLAITNYNRRASARIPDTAQALPRIAWAQDVEFGLMLTYVQSWTCTGYQRGELLSSFSITPGGEVHVEVFTWDRTRIEQERDTEVSSEQSQVDSITGRVALDTVTNTRFKVGAGAEYKGESSLDLAEFGVPADVKVGEKVNVDGEFENSVTNTRNQVIEATQSSTQSLRASRKTRVVEVAERGQENRTTYTHKNTNRCLAVTYDYFEVLENYDVAIKLTGVQLVVLLPLQKPAVITAEYLLCHEHVIRPYLPSTALSDGFDAARMVAAAAVFSGRFVTKPLPFQMPHVQLGGLFPPRQAPADPVRTKLMPHVDAIVQACKTLRAASLDPALDVIGRKLDFWNSQNDPSDDEYDAGIKVGGQYMFRELLLSVDHDFFDQVDLLDKRTRGPSSNVQENLSIFLTGVAPLTLNLTFGQTIRYVLGVPLPFNDAGLTGALTAASAALQEVRNVPPLPATPLPSAGAGTSPPAASGPDEKPTLDDLLDESFGLKALAEATVDLNRLVCHVQDKLDYYLGLIVADEGPSEWTKMIANYPHLDGVVIPRLITVDRGFAVFPFSATRQTDFADINKELLAKVTSKDASKGTSVTMPTHGVVMEARIGQCSACEPFVEDHRKLDLQMRAAEVARAKAEANKAELEAERYKDRLAAKDPKLDDPTPAPPSLTVQVVGKPPSAADDSLEP